MQNTTDILDFIDTFLADHADWLPSVSVDFALDIRSMLESISAAELETAA